MPMLYALLKSATPSVSLSSLHVARTLSLLIGRHHYSDLFATVNILRGIFATVEKACSPGFMTSGFGTIAHLCTFDFAIQDNLHVYVARHRGSLSWLKLACVIAPEQRKTSHAAYTIHTVHVLKNPQPWSFAGLKRLSLQ
jgi:hypothetical protein